MSRSRTRSGRAFPALALCVVAALTAGCFWKALRQEEQAHRSLATLRGTVRTAHATSHPLVVILGRFEERGELEIADSYTVVESGSWSFRVRPGRYALGAFEDVSEDLVYRNEPALLPQEGSTAGRGTRLTPEAPEATVSWASWRDLAPDSDFLRGLFRTSSGGRQEPRRLPPGVAYHLVFGHPDAVVPPESALLLAEHEEARVLRFPAGHVEILKSAEASAWVNQLLARDGK